VSADAAAAFLDRVESDEAFATDLQRFMADPTEVLIRVRDAGFDVTQAEVRDAFLDRHGGQLDPEQLDQIAAGYDDSTNLAAVLAGTGGIAVAVAGAALAAG